MEDSAARAVRSKRDSSLRVASRLVRDGLFDNGLGRRKEGMRLKPV
jgi:fatty acid/phospholipid biosynthesis enzyme